MKSTVSRELLNCFLMLSSYSERNESPLQSEKEIQASSQFILKTGIGYHEAKLDS